jgi:predicted metal-dependent HD superfamily phosphohydrolase
MGALEPAVVEAIAIARERLEDGLPDWLRYHDLAHTTEFVAPDAELLGRAVGLDDHELGLLLVAAWFHDVGFVERYEDNEVLGVAIATEALEGLGFDPDDVAAVAAAIWATRLPQVPTTVLGELLCDADLSVLASTRFLERDAGLHAELAHEGKAGDEQDWARRQLAFLESHSWFTEAAASQWGERKAENVAALRRRVAG